MTVSTIPAFREPAPLAPGARVALVSPSGALHGEADVAHAVASARSMGWDVEVGAHVLARDGYFAGDTATRWRDFEWALTSRDIDGIWCLRGGYGAARLLPMLTPTLLREHHKALLGYSDITALHAAWGAASLVSFHAPTARSLLTDFTRQSLVRCVQEGGDGCGDVGSAMVLRDGIVTGRLAGGNLALVASVCGTPWAIDFRGAIVVLEDINEATYRVDRMLTQLRLSGALNECIGLVFGQCTNCPEAADEGSRTLEFVVRECADILEVPTMLGVPIGHIADQWTFPLGALATLNTDSRTVQVHRASHV